MADIAPLTPSDCDLTDFAFMPLDVARLRDSELASNETPEACWAAVQLWAAAWHQIPAGSVPNDDKWMAKATGYGRIVKEWMRVREGALRGWVLCSDGRLYHTVVAEKAREAWNAKIEQRYRTEVARVKKHNQRNGTSHTTPDFETWLSLGRPQGHHLSVPGDKPTKTEDGPTESVDTGGDMASKREREGQGQGQGDSNSVTDVTDGAAVKSPDDMTKDELWSVGKSLLLQAGMPKVQCGTFVGKLCKDYGNDIVIEAVRATCVRRPADPAEYLKAACMRAKGERANPNKQEALEQRNRKVADEWVAEMQARGEKTNTTEGDILEAV
jgi:hypothetical protein